MMSRVLLKIEQTTNLFEKVNISLAILFASCGVDKKVETILDPIEAK